MVINFNICSPWRLKLILNFWINKNQKPQFYFIFYLIAIIIMIVLTGNRTHRPVVRVIVVLIQFCHSGFTSLCFALLPRIPYTTGLIAWFKFITTAVICILKHFQCFKIVWKLSNVIIELRFVKTKH